MSLKETIDLFSDLPGRDMPAAAETPTVDVVIPCFNDGMFLQEAIDSLGPRNGTGRGVIIVNDGSTEAGTIDVLAQLRMRGFTVIDQANLGLSAARNAGWRRSEASHVLFLDADNRVDRAYVAQAIARFQADPELAVVYADKSEFGLREGVVTQRDVDLPALLVGNRIDACTVVRRSALQEVGGFDEHMRTGYEDWELWIRLMSAGFRFAHLSEPLFHYRVREGSLVTRADDPKERERILNYVTRKHATLFARHARAVVIELHRIQAHDKVLLQEAAAVAAQARTSADGALASVQAMQGEVEALRSEHAREQEVAADQRRAIEEQLGASRASLEELHRQQALSATRQAELSRSIDVLDREKSDLAVEAHRLVGEVDKALQALDAHREHARALQALLAQYEARIKAIEGSKLWRLRMSWYRMRALLRTSSSTSNRGLRWIKRVAFLISAKGRTIARRFMAKVFKALYLWTEIRPVRILVGDEQLRAASSRQGDAYGQWMERHFARPSDLQDHREQIELLEYTPLISILMPVYDPPIDLLEKAIRSVRDQVYDRWELCIAEDHGKDGRVRKLLERLMKEDDRIRVVFRTENGHISRASNTALELARGEFTALMDHDDLLAPDALYHVVKLLNRKPDLDLIYTDEDKVNEEGHHSEPHFKPQWCPDHLLSRNYFGHLVVMRTGVMRASGGFRPGFEGSQDYDLLLRFTERTERIARIPRVLYHWRIHAGSAARSEEVKPYAYQAAKLALTEALERRGEPGEVSYLEGFRGYGVRPRSPLRGRVSIIIPTCDKPDILGTCLRSLFRLTEHPDFEVLVVSNNSTEPALFQLLEEMSAQHKGWFRWLRHDVPFNFSELMNFGIANTSGEQLLFLNNDTEIMHTDWLRAMHAWSQRPTTGAVGVKLLYPNDTIQHAGVIVGLGGVAGHSFTHQHRDGPGYFNYINTINNYSAVTAACMMVERNKLEAIGGWDEAFTVEYNDVDLCLRLRDRGWHNLYLPHVQLYHFESLTRGHPHMTRESYERHLREVKLFQERWADVVADDPCYNPNLSRGVHDWSFAL